MKPTTSTINKISEEGLKHFPEEAVGFVVHTGKKQLVYPCKNKASGTEDALNMFVLDAYSRTEISKKGDILWLYHTHPITSSRASEGDLLGCKKSGVPWLIVAPHTKEFTIIEPDKIDDTFEIANRPILGRQFIWGIQDCYALVRDFYLKEFKIDLPDYDRGLLFDWNFNPDWNKFEDLFTDAGFTITQAPFKKGDVLLMNIRSTKINHCGVIAEPDKNIFYHHLLDHLSQASIYGSWYREVTRKIIRYREL